MSKNRQVEYIPPAAEVIDEYARKFCEATGVNDREVRTGFADFIKVIARIMAKQMTDESNRVDDGSSADNGQ